MGSGDCPCLYVYGFETLFILLCQEENEKPLICDIDGQSAKYVLHPRAPRLCL